MYRLFSKVFLLVFEVYFVIEMGLGKYTFLSYLLCQVQQGSLHLFYYILKMCFCAAVNWVLLSVEFPQAKLFEMLDIAIVNFEIHLNYLGIVHYLVSLVLP